MLVLVASGLTVDSCIDVANQLGDEGIHVRVINVINPNALDAAFGQLIADRHPVVTVYNDHPRVLRQAVADALLQGSVRPSYIQGLGFTIGNTGTFEEMRAWTGLDTEEVMNACYQALL